MCCRTLYGQRCSGPSSFKIKFKSFPSYFWELVVLQHMHLRLWLPPQGPADLPPKHFYVQNHFTHSLRSSTLFSTKFPSIFKFGKNVFFWAHKTFQKWNFFQMLFNSFFTYLHWVLKICEFFFFKIIYSFIYGCVGSPFPCEGFL